MNDSVLEDGIIATIDELNLFEPPVIQSAVQRSLIVEYRPTSHLSAAQDTPIHFRLGGDSRNYLDLEKTRLFVKAKIVNDDGTALEKGEGKPEVAPVNLTLQSMWSMIELKLSGKTMSMMCNGCYPYIAMLQTLLRNSETAKSGHLSAQMFFKDNNMDDTTLNVGFIERLKKFQKSQSVTMEGPLMVDFFSTPRYILCNTPIDLTLYRSRPEFLLMTAKDDKKYKFVIEDICLKAKYIEVHPGVISGHSEALKRSANAIYPYTKVDCKCFNIPKDSTSFSFDNIFNNSTPQKVICAFVEAEAFSGKLSKNAFNFQHFNLSQIELNIDGVSAPSRPLDFVFDADGTQAATPYLRMYDCVGASNNPLFGIGLSLADYCEGHTIICFPLNALDKNYLEVNRTANVTIQGTFQKALESSVTLLVYSESPTVAEIDQTRNVILH